MTDQQDIRIRRATLEDADTLIGLIEALAAYEELEGPDEAARARLVEHAFGPQPKFEAYLAEIADEPVAYAITFMSYSTFLAQPCLYLEDLFVLPNARQLGVGRALFQSLARIALERECGRFEWTVLDWNELALGFYRKLGGRQLDEWRHYRLTEDQIRLIALSAPATEPPDLC